MKKILKTLLYAVPALFIALVLYTIAPFGAGKPLRGPESGLVFYNGTIITMDKEKPAAEAVAIKGDRILYVGSLDEAIRKLGPSARRVDLKGKTLIPGFNDNHTHAFAGSTYHEAPRLWGKSCKEIARIVREEARKKKPGEIITGNSWDYPTCPKPHKSMLDEAAPDNPVFLYQYSGHAAWVNSRALKELGIDRGTPDPQGGQIVRDENGDPTGVLRDTAMGKAKYTNFLAGALSPGRHRQIMERALVLFREEGITSVQDNTWMPMTGWTLHKLRKEGRLTCRFTQWPYGDPDFARLLMKLVPCDGKWLRPGPVKFFADGAFSTRTAWLLDEAYADEKGNFGSPIYKQERIESIVMAAAKHKRQITFHAIGDGAVRAVVRAVEKAAKRYPHVPELRFRLEHVQLASPEDIKKMKKLGMVACVQPFALYNPKKDITLLGKERARRAYPYRSLYDAGVPVAFGSDIPAEVDFEPLLGIYYAVTRKSKDGADGPLNPEERFAPLEALYCYTLGSAYAEFMEKEKGSLTAGKLADMVVLSDDLTRVPPEKIKDIRVLLTVAGGVIVYERDGFAGVK